MVWIIIGLVVAVIVGVILFFVLRMMKGKIRLEMPKSAYAVGETIAGSVNILAKKQIESNRLIVSLIGVEHREYREDGETKTDRNEVFRNEVVIHEKKSYRMQDEETVDFSMSGASETDSESGGIAGAIQTGVQMLSGGRRRIKWHIEARLDCPGLDLVTTRNISVSG